MTMEGATVATDDLEVEVSEVRRLSDFSKVTNLGERSSLLTFIDTQLLQFTYHVHTSTKNFAK